MVIMYRILYTYVLALKKAIKSLHNQSVLRIRDVYPGSRIRLFTIPDPDPNIFRSGFTSKNLSILTQKNVFLSSRKYDPSCSSRILILIFYPSWIPDRGIKKALDPGSASATLQSINFCKIETNVSFHFCQGSEREQPEAGPAGGAAAGGRLAAGRHPSQPPPPHLLCSAGECMCRSPLYGMSVNRCTISVSLYFTFFAFVRSRTFYDFL